VLKSFTASLFSLLLIGTFLWGGCISCEKYFMWPDAKSCCAPDGHCKRTSAPQKQSAGRECKLIAFDKQKQVEIHIDLPPAAAAPIHAPRPVEPYAPWRGPIPNNPSPPNFQALHSTFLI